MTAPPSFLCDTSVLVAILSPWNPMHERSRVAITNYRDMGNTLCIAAHSVVETYSVLTRMPPPHRITATAAGDAVSALLGGARVVALSAAEVVERVSDMAADDIRGGAVYDALIIETAIEAGVDEILTSNVRDFERLARGRIRVVAPPELPADDR